MAGAPARVGILVNPVAGMGGRVALKGTDGPEALELARRLGAVPVAPERARRALERLARELGPVTALAAPGAMGADEATAAGLDVTATGDAPSGPTTAADTAAGARALRDAGVDLLLLAGGDGTARDVVDAIGDALPLVGVPTGVKMHSGVFATSPDAAGRAAAAFLRDPVPERLVLADVADVDEAAVRAGRAGTRLHGHARVPREPALMMAAKAPSAPHGDRDLDALCRTLAEEVLPGETLILGPGTTTARILAHLGLEGTLLGVDAVRDGAVVGRDLTEAELLALLDGDGDGDARLVLGVVGGQGSLLGRGNQQLGPAVLRRLAARIEIVAAADKLLALQSPVLRVDTGDDELDLALSGHRRVRVAPTRTMIMKVST